MIAAVEEACNWWH